MSLYGYSLSSCLYVSVICVLPSNVLQWIMMGYAFVTSTFLLLNVLSKMIVNIEDPLKYGALGGVCACQLALFITLKVLFLNMSA